MKVEFDYVAETLELKGICFGLADENGGELEDKGVVWGNTFLERYQLVEILAAIDTVSLGSLLHDSASHHSEYDLARFKNDKAERQIRFEADWIRGMGWEHGAIAVARDTCHVAEAEEFAYPSPPNEVADMLKAYFEDDLRFSSFRNFCYERGEIDTATSLMAWLKERQ